MDTTRFDALTRMIGRRGLLGAALALAGFGKLPDSVEGGNNGLVQACDQTGSGGRCKRNDQCCSGICQLKKRKKKKNGKKRKKRGRCQCSPLQAGCASVSDCCSPPLLNALLPVCDVRIGNPRTICCMPGGGQCSLDADCCGNAQCVDRHCEAV
jgi:hypothetical protein